MVARRDHNSGLSIQSNFINNLIDWFCSDPVISVVTLGTGLFVETQSDDVFTYELVAVQNIFRSCYD